MTEAEAVTKWCPFARVPATAVNRIPGGPAHPAAHCLASDCMAWRWKDAAATTGDCGLTR